MVESGYRRKRAKLASQESLPREGRAAASCGDRVRLAMRAVVEWADGGVRRGWRRFGGIGSAAPCGLGRKWVSLQQEEPSPLGQACRVSQSRNAHCTVTAATVECSV